MLLSNIEEAYLKRILKEILYSHVPEHIFNRPKSGFAVPLNHWFKNELKDYVLDELSSKNLSEIPGVKANEDQKEIKNHMSGNWNHFSIIWKLLVLRQWLANNGKGISIV